MKLVAAMLYVAASFLLPSLAHAQQFPARTVTIVIPFSPGGANDILARYLADGLAKEWGQTVIVENRPGAGGSIGVAHMVKSKPDGYTLAFSSSTLATNAAAQRNLPFDAKNGLQPVSMVAIGDMLAVSGSRLRLLNLSDVVREAKSRKIFYATNGIGISTFASELFNDVADIEMEGVNYKGAAEMLIDLGGGRVDLFFGTAASLLPAIASKTVTPLAVLGQSRLAALPDVPTVAEAGFAGAEFNVWWGIFAPAATPKGVLSRINESISKIMRSTASAEVLRNVGATVPPSMTPDEFRERYLHEVQRLEDLAKGRKIVVE